MTHLWKWGANLYTAGLLGIGLFVGSLLLLGWSPTEAALPEEDVQESVMGLETLKSKSCMRAVAGNLTIDVVGYQEQADGTTRILYWVTNTREELIKHVSFGIGNWQPVSPADGSTYSGALGEYQVKWAGPNIKFRLQDQKPDHAGYIDIFELVVRDFDPNTEIQVNNEASDGVSSASLKLNSNACKGRSRPTHNPSSEAEVVLEYVAQTYDIPIENLKVTNDHLRVYPNLGRKFQAVVVWDTRPEGLFYTVMIDKESGEIIDNMNTIVQEEAEAYTARYGKMSQDLYERLEEIDDDETLPIAIWVNGEHPTDRQNIKKAVAKKFPEAARNLEQGNRLWDVEDQELREEIRQEYERLTTERTEKRARPLIQFMQRKFDAQVTTFGSMPAVVAQLTKKQIRTLENRPQVGMMYLAEGTVEPNADIAIPSDRVSQVWNNRNLDGTGVTIAILEDGAIDNIPCLNVTGNNQVVQPAENHKTTVASVATCNDTTSIYDGVARGASLYDARIDYTDLASTINGLISATVNAPIVNFSAGWRYPYDVDALFIRSGFDYWARENEALVVVAAGNSAYSTAVESPANAWNVLTVGGSDDQNSIAWQDDTMYYIAPNAQSAYGNRISTDHEKPEVVAPAVDIATYGLHNTLSNQSGTSLAAPQVSGLAALLIQRDATLADWPEATKAIIMASATNNIIGPLNIVSTHGDLRDGAGAINALHADDIAQNYHDPFSIHACQDSCWSGHSYDIPPASTTSDAVVYLGRFHADSGQYVRIVTSWWAEAGGPATGYAGHQIGTDLDLKVEYQNGNSFTSIAASSSINNNYEMVGFNATYDGTYHIYVTRKNSSTELSNSFGVALLKLPYTAGDVNCNGSTNVIDALFALQALFGFRVLDTTSTSCANYPSSSPALTAACNVNGDTYCDIWNDVIAILQCEVGISNAYLCPSNSDDYEIYIPQVP